MRIWIDLGNSPHVPFFSALSKEFERRGHKILWTARDYAQTVELALKAKLDPVVVGGHGGKSVLMKGFKFGSRSFQLLNWTRGKNIDLVVSHNSHEPLLVSRAARIRSVNLMDYEHHPANHLSFRLANRVIVPKSFPDEFLKKFGAYNKTRKFDGIKEDVYLPDFIPDKSFENELAALGITTNHILIVVRPHANEALYHRRFSNDTLSVMLEEFLSDDRVRILLLPRTKKQGENISGIHQSKNLIIPEKILDGANLIHSADLVVSGGGTMNREAAALGVPAATIFAGKMAAVDEYLVKENRLQKIAAVDDLKKLTLEKKVRTKPRKFSQIRRKVADLILNTDNS